MGGDRDISRNIETTQIIKFVVNKLDKYQKLLGAQKKALGEALKVLTDTVAIQEATAKLLARLI